MKTVTFLCSLKNLLATRPELAASQLRWSYHETIYIAVKAFAFSLWNDDLRHRKFPDKADLFNANH